MARSRKPQKNTNQSSRGGGGYRIKLQPIANVIEEQLEVPTPSYRKLPDGLAKALGAKRGLVEALSVYTKYPYTVSVDLREDDQWFFTIRGFQPPFSNWNGYEVVYKKSTLVRNPQSRFGQLIG